MAESSLWWTTDGVGDGTDTGYTAAQITQFWRYLFTQDPTTECVVPGALNELAVTGVASPVSMATGYAVVDGTAYKNDAAKDVAVATPVVGTTGHRVVLRATWGATQTTRVALLSSADGVAAIPACTQTSGTLYEVSLATLVITTGGTITVTDDRHFCHFGTDVETAMIEDGAVSLAKMAADSVDDTKCGNRVPQMYRRQGGSATDWNTSGTTARTPTTVRMQCGVVATTGGGATVTFPVAFSAKPVVIVAPINDAPAYVGAVSITTTNFVVSVVTGDAKDIAWLAIGPE